MVKFKFPNFEFYDFKNCFLKNVETIQKDFNKISSSNSNCAQIYCQLVEGLWDENILGEFKNEMYAVVLQMYILVNSNPYYIHKYCSCNNPYSEHNISEIEFIERCISSIYSERYLKNFSNFTDLFQSYSNKLV